MTTAINYVANPSDRVVRFIFDNDWTGAQRVPIQVEIVDARPTASHLSLDRQGFVLDRIVSGVTDYRDPEQVHALWAPAAAERVRRVTGAKWTTWWAPNIRFSNRNANSTSTPVAGPAPIVHSDLQPSFDPLSIDEEPGSLMAAAEVTRRLGGRPPKRWRTFNVWQQISPPPKDAPLAVCDLSTVSVEDLLEGQAPDPMHGGKPFVITFWQQNPRHRWYYFSDMLPGEAIIFSALNTEAGGICGRVPHVAFELPDRRPNFVPRNSIDQFLEMRWDPPASMMLRIS